MHKYEITEEHGITTFKAVDWSPLEASFVTVPADNDVGSEQSGRSLQEPSKSMEFKKMGTKKVEDKKVDAQIIVTNESKALGESTDNTISERDRVTTILDLGRAHKKEADSLEAVRNGHTIEDFKSSLLKSAENNKKNIANLDLTNKERHRYSMMNALRALQSNDWSKAGFELECSKAVEGRTGKPARGFYLPTDIAIRGLSVGVDTAGGFLVDEDLRGDQFIELLRNKMVVMEAGARSLSDLNGDVLLPKQTGAGTAFWIAEDGTVAESSQTLGQIALRPKTIGAFTDISRKMLLQSSLDIENFVVNDFTTILAIAIDLAALSGSGANGQPLGIINSTGVSSTTWASTSDPTFAEIVGLETNADSSNALIGDLKYITSSTIRGALKVKDKSTSTAQFIWEDNMVNGWPALVTNQLDSDKTIFGNWNDLIIGFWGGVDINLDTATNSTSGALRVVLLQSTDIAIRHIESFAIGTD